ncbi:MAG: hypothetical protein JSV62_14510 [Promethearchaeota archaeon]|nr:MAG: hypothetical protein JSV62_14510 [Candidatus Lokiarchaeota archaeon]
MKKKREKVNCPVCSFKFIPESFLYEKTGFDHVVTKGELIEFPNGNHQLELKPFTSLRGSLVTYCPQCGYLMKFAAEVGRKEILEDPSLIKKLGSIKEFGKVYKYQFNSTEKPYMDYSDYFIEKADNIKKLIKNALDEVNFEQWGTSYKKWKEDKSVDSFKFLIHFYSTLVDYLDSQVEDYTNKSVAQKIEELNLPKNLEILTKNVNDLRNKVAHEVYEIDETEEALIESTFTQFMRYLIVKQLTPLNLNKIEIEQEYDFIELDKIKYEIQEFLHVYLGKLLPIKEFYDLFLTPLFEELGVKTPDYNP